MLATEIPTSLGDIVL